MKNRLQQTPGTTYVEQRKSDEGRKATFKAWINLALAILTLLLALSDVRNVSRLWTIEAA